MNLKSNLLLIFLALLSLPAFSREAPEDVRIIDVRLRGSGCHLQSSNVLLSPDSRDLSIFFDQYSAEIGEGSENPNSLKAIKECHIQVQLAVPHGWQMAFRGVDYRGFVSLESQGTAFHRFSILQQGAPIVSMREAFLQGPLNTDYYVRHEVRPERITWSPCFRSGQAHVNLISQLGVSLNPRHSSRDFTQIVLDSADTSFKQNLSISWRQCSSPHDDRNPPGVKPAPERPGVKPRPEVPPGRGEDPPRPPRYGGR